MLRTKKDIDKHVRSTLSKLREDEKNLRGYRIACLYYNIGEYSSALEYIQRYIQANDKNPSAYKVLGQCYEKLKRPDKQLLAYQCSLELDKKQTDLLVEVCELLIAESNVTAPLARYYAELAESHGIHVAALLDLKLKFMNGGDQTGVQDIILKEIKRRPLDIGLRNRLLYYYLDQNRPEEAFKHVFDIELKANSEFRNSNDWYSTVSVVLDKYKANNKATINKNWQYWLLLITTIERQLFLTLVRSPKDTNTINRNLLEATNLLFELDQNLNKVATVCSFPDSERDLASEFLSHFRGQLSLHAASLLFKREAEQSQRGNWHETTKTTLPLLLLAINFGSIDSNQLWLWNASEATKQLMDSWQAQSSFRVSQAARTLQSCVSNSAHSDNAELANLRKICLDKCSNWANRDDVLNEIRSIVADSDWRKKLYRNLFIRKEQQSATLGSYFINSRAFEVPIFEWPDANKLTAIELKSQEADPSNLGQLVYLALGNDASKQSQITIDPGFKCDLFKNLNYSVVKLMNCSAENLNQVDIHTFLYATTLQTKRTISMENTIPKILPYANMASILTNHDQSEWWTAAFKIYQNTAGEELAELRATLQYGIEAVRGVGTPRMDLMILLKLGQILSKKAQNTTKAVERGFLEDRSEALFKFSLYMLRIQNSSRSASEPFRRMFKYTVGNNFFEIEHEINALAEEAITFLAGRYFGKNAYEECIEDFSGIKLPFATYFQAESYRKLTKISDTPKKNKRAFLDKARDYLKQTLELLDGPNIDKNHPLKTIVNEDIKRLHNETRKLETNHNEDSFVSEFSHDLSLDHHSESSISTDDGSFYSACDDDFQISKTSFNKQMEQMQEQIFELRQRVETLECSSSIHEWPYEISYVHNSATDTKCLSCGSPKDKNSPQESSKSKASKSNSPGILSNIFDTSNACAPKYSEEDENVLFSYRAELFRFRDPIWEIRGMGDVKILQYIQTGQLRVVMYDEKINKICLDCDLKSLYSWMTEDSTSWQFIANDFSEQQFECENFCLRFETEEISRYFKTITDLALSKKPTGDVQSVKSYFIEGGNVSKNAPESTDTKYNRLLNICGSSNTCETAVENLYCAPCAGTNIFGSLNAGVNTTLTIVKPISQLHLLEFENRRKAIEWTTLHPLKSEISYHFHSSEWRERGLSDVKIVQHKTIEREPCLYYTEGKSQFSFADNQKSTAKDDDGELHTEDSIIALPDGINVISTGKENKEKLFNVPVILYRNIMMYCSQSPQIAVNYHKIMTLLYGIASPCHDEYNSQQQMVSSYVQKLSNFMGLLQQLHIQVPLTRANLSLLASLFFGDVNRPLPLTKPEVTTFCSSAISNYNVLNKDTLFESKAVLFRFSNAQDSWRIRGNGIIKILACYHSNRLLMVDFDDYILCDHKISRNTTKFCKLDCNHVIWINSDAISYNSWQHMFKECLGLRFESNIICEEFFALIQKIQLAAANHDNDEYDGSWWCERCYTINSPINICCVRCTSNPEQSKSDLQCIDANLLAPKKADGKSQSPWAAIEARFYNRNDDRHHGVFLQNHHGNIPVQSADVLPAVEDADVVKFKKLLRNRLLKDEQSTLSAVIKTMTATLHRENTPADAPVYSSAVKDFIHTQKNGNIICISPTGTGKTEAILTAILSRWRPERIIIVFCATHDSAYVAYMFMRTLAAGQFNVDIISKDLNVCSEKVHVLIGTPRDVMDYINTNDVSKCSEIFFDDADAYISYNYMVDFLKSSILCQSAYLTITAMTHLKKNVMNVLQRIGNVIKWSPLRVPSLERIKMKHYFMNITNQQIQLEVIKALCLQINGQVIIFCLNRHQTSEIVAGLQPTLKTLLHTGNMTYDERRQSIQSIQEGDFQILVTTDVLSRGINGPNILAVVNTSLPVNAKTFDLRVGRCTRPRFGAAGISLTFADRSALLIFQKRSELDFEHHYIDFN